ncbi:MAG: glycosyltransferase [Caldilineaceae bacterium]
MPMNEVPRLLKHFPDYNRLDQIPQVEAKSSVLPVGIDCSRIQERTVYALDHTEKEHTEKEHSESNSVPVILWNQRWEYDKDPASFFACLYALQERGINFRVAVAGENFRQIPQEFAEAHTRLADKIVHWGYATSVNDYIALLHRADLVISTALHEFFGISILEAIIAGAFPLLPSRLSYPELIPAALHPACLYHDDAMLIELSAQRLQMPRPAPPSLRDHVLAHFDWPVVAAQYDALCDRLIG